MCLGDEYSAECVRFREVSKYVPWAELLVWSGGIRVVVIGGWLRFQNMEDWRNRVYGGRETEGQGHKKTHIRDNSSDFLVPLVTNNARYRHRN